ncbi:MAG: hypothetical protein LUC90_07080, partial [Lachnospiraceae bacterium]|nr:hypothetical protein [Lachnospiraceae bacterium]
MPASGSLEPETSDSEESGWDAEDQELLSLFMDFSGAAGGGEESAPAKEAASLLTMEEMIDYIKARAALSIEEGLGLPFHDICTRLSFENFTVFCLACSILSSTQTDYAGIFQVINENGNLPAPTIESAAKLYYGDRFSITGAYGDMSVCLE